MRVFLSGSKEGAFIANSVSESVGIIPWVQVAETIKTKVIQGLIQDEEGSLFDSEGIKLFDGTSKCRVAEEIEYELDADDDYNYEYYEDDYDDTLDAYEVRQLLHRGLCDIINEDYYGCYD